jgi:hypothetical protein
VGTLLGTLLGTVALARAGRPGAQTGGLAGEHQCRLLLEIYC